MPDYSKNEIYKIICNLPDTDFVYVGHTTNHNARYIKHKSSSLHSNAKVYHKIRELGGFANFSMIHIEKYPCDNEREAHEREQYWIEKLSANMNTLRAYRSEEYKKQYYKEFHKEYDENNKDHKKEYNQEYYEQNKEHYKEYRENNKERIREKQYKKFECPCGGRYTFHHKARHLKCKKHTEWQSNQI